MLGALLLILIFDILLIRILFNIESAKSYSAEFSPNFVFGNQLVFMPNNNFQISFLSKFISEQYMGNIDSDNSKLDAYFVSDLNVSYEWKINKGLKSMVFSALVNNLFNLEYESNGYFYTYDDDFSNPGTISTIEGAGFFPQAGINFLAGITLKF